MPPITKFLRRSIDERNAVPGASTLAVQVKTFATGGAAAAAPPTAAAATAGAVAQDPAVQSIREQRARHALQCLAQTGSYIEAVGPILNDLGPESVVTLLWGIANRTPAADPRGYAVSGSRPSTTMEHSDALGLLVTVLSHRRFVELFIEAGGIRVLTSYPRTPHTFLGLSLCLCALSTFPTTFTKYLSTMRESPGLVTALALELLNCGREHARCNAAAFFRQALMLPLLLEPFERQEGVKKLAIIIRASLALAKSDPHGKDTTPTDMKLERQVRPRNKPQSSFTRHSTSPLPHFSLLFIFIR